MIKIRKLEITGKEFGWEDKCDVEEYEVHKKIKISRRKGKDGVRK